eukprot:COSAG02_NODE_14216_length_1296_cov_1.518797_1_plen_157_part_00
MGCASVRRDAGDCAGDSVGRVTEVVPRMLGVAGFQRSSITVKPRKSELMGPIPIGEGERARWSFSIDRFTFKLAAWFIPNPRPVSPPPVGTDGGASQVPAPRVGVGEEQPQRVEIFPERLVGIDDDDDAEDGDGVDSTADAADGEDVPAENGREEE